MKGASKDLAVEHVDDQIRKGAGVLQPPPHFRAYRPFRQAATPDALAFFGSLDSVETPFCWNMLMPSAAPPTAGIRTHALSHWIFRWCRPTSRTWTSWVRCLKIAVYIIGNANGEFSC
jgi:hypothetical protein